MGIPFFRRLLNFLLLCALQVMILNHLHLFGVATPMFCLIFLLHFPRNDSRSSVMLWSFAMGLVIDIFGNTPGVASASLTLLGALQPYILLMFMPREFDDTLTPSLHTLGFRPYAFYMLVIVFAYCLLFFSLEMFCVFHWLYWLECVVGSTLLTMLMIVIVELFGRRP